MLIIMSNKISKDSSILCNTQYMLISSLKHLSCSQFVYFDLSILYKNFFLSMSYLLFAIKFDPSILLHFALPSLFCGRRGSYVIVTGIYLKLKAKNLW